jgi:hypothetical protein
MSAFCGRALTAGMALVRVTECSQIGYEREIVGLYVVFAERSVALEPYHAGAAGDRTEQSCAATTTGGNGWQKYKPGR